VVKGEVECVLDARAVLGEGALWSAAESAFWFVDIDGDRVHRFDTLTGAHVEWHAPSRPGFIVPRRAGGFLVGARVGLYDFDTEAGEFVLRLRVEQEVPNNRINDGHVDAAGRLWFGTMDDAHRTPSGALYRYGDGCLVRCDDGYIITNGPAFCAATGTLYHTDTLAKTIYAFEVDTDGKLSGKREFARIDRGNPDGLAVDAEGCVWSALYGGWGANRYAPSGELVGHLALPCANVTKLAFGGDDLRTIYATSARGGLSPAELEEQPLAGGVFRARAEVEGQPHHAFAG
jgi:sugar lactone lactonase YvrE